MKKIMMFLIACCVVITVQAQEKEVKNTYVKKGDRIEATIYHDNGQVSQTGYYTLAGKLTGEWVSYCKKGTKTAVAKYDNGEKVGKWFFWNGDTLTEVDYKDSQITAVNEWRNEGTRVVSNR